MTELQVLQVLREIVQAERLTVLTRLVERMGEVLSYLWTGGEYNLKAGPLGPDGDDYPFTPAGQREYDAAMHEAEGYPAKGTFLEYYQGAQDERVERLEKRTDIIAEAASKALQEIRGLFPATERVAMLEKRLAHLEAVVFDEGEPEGHGLVEDVQ